MLVVPLTDTFAQTLRVTLGGQSCRIDLRQRTVGGLYCDLYVDDAPIVLGVACQNRNPLVRGAYLGFVGNLAFVDAQGTDDPVSPGLGERFQLCYLEPGEVLA